MITCLTCLTCLSLSSGAYFIRFISISPSLFQHHYLANDFEEC